MVERCKFDLMKTHKKEDFTIEGSVALLKAFVEESGLNSDKVDLTDNEHPYLTSLSGERNGLDQSCMKFKKHFILPQDWNEALEYVKLYFQPEFKVGDWVTVTWKPDHYWITDKDPITFQVKGGAPFYATQESGIGGTHGLRDCKLRKATPSEIEAAQPKEKIVSVGGKFDVKITKEGIFHGSDGITGFVRDMLSEMTCLDFANFNADIKEITFSRTGCQHVETTLSDWRKVWGEYKAQLS